MTNAETIHLRDETRLNVASLLMEDVGGRRDLMVELSRFPLDEDLVARDVTGKIRLTRIQAGILAQGQIMGVVELECARCLQEYYQPFRGTFAEEFHQTVDVRNGAGVDTSRTQRVSKDDDDEIAFEINDAHEMDLTELIRQWIVLELPMRPDCGEDCPGPPAIAEDPDARTDSRFAALEQLLGDDDQA
jgi:uncharacterized protein